MQDPRERRRDTRIPIPDDLMAVSERAAPYDLRLLDVSRGGFLVRGPLPYPIDARRPFRFSMKTPDWSVELHGQAMYSQSRSADGGRYVEYLTGFAFVNPENRNVAQRIDDLMARAVEIHAAQVVDAPANR
jgi:hypothetical protein